MWCSENIFISFSFERWSPTVSEDICCCLLSWKWEEKKGTVGFPHAAVRRATKEESKPGADVRRFTCLVLIVWLGLGTKNHLVRVRKRSRFGVKQLENVKYSAKSPSQMLQPRRLSLGRRRLLLLFGFWVMGVERWEKNTKKALIFRPPPQLLSLYCKRDINLSDPPSNITNATHNSAGR